MEALTNAEAALLGLLSERPMHPYRIEKEVQYRDMRFWTDLSMSSIYKLLRSMESRGFVRSELEITEDNRTRKVYHLTPEGRGALRVSLQQILSEPEHQRWAMDIAISNLGVLDRADAISRLREYRGELEERVEQYGELEAFLAGENCPVHRLALARRPMHLLRGELAWVDEYIEQLSGEGGEG